MSKTLLINASLKHACDFVEPFLHRLEVYLDKQGEEMVQQNHMHVLMMH